MSTRALSQYRVTSGRRGQHGVVLILAVFAVVLLTVLAVGIAAVVRVELRASRSSLDRMQALFLAEAGKNQARAVLLYDDPGVDTLIDEWGPKAEEPLDLPHELGDGFYRVRVYDACGRIDINEADYAVLLRLTGDPVAAASILDWRDDGEGVTPDGAEKEYYAGLPWPYVPRNAPFQTPGELLLVRGVTPQMFFGSKERPGLVDLITVDSESSNTDVNGAPRMLLNEFRNWGESAFQNSVMAKFGSALDMYEAQEIFRGLLELTELGLDGYTSLAQLASAAGLDFGTIAQIIDSFTVEMSPVERGKVNVNTAPLEVLAALPGSSESVAEAMIVSREAQPFRSLGDVVTMLLDLPDGPALFEQIIDRVRTKSSTFVIESMGRTRTGHTHRTLSALVRRTPDAVYVIRQVERDQPLPPLDEQAQQSVAIARR